MKDIDYISPLSGRMIKEDGSVVNIADKINTLVPTPETFTFHDAVIATGQGNILDVGNYKNLTVNIFGSATERKINFYSVNLNNDLVPLMGYNISNSLIDIFTYLSPNSIPAYLGENNSQTFQFEITNLNKIVMEIETISGGNITVIGKLS